MFFFFVELEFFFIFVLVVLNGIFFGLEIVIVLVCKVCLEQLVKWGNCKVKLVLKLVIVFNNFLLVVQIGIILIGILIGVVGGVMVVLCLVEFLDDIFFLVFYVGFLSIFLLVGFIIYLFLVVGELVFKCIVFSYLEYIVCGVVLVMYLVVQLIVFLVYFLGVFIDVVLWLFGIISKEVSLIMEEEIWVMIEQGVQVGMIDEVEQEMVEWVFCLGDCFVKILMIFCMAIVWLDVELDWEEN